VTGEAWAAIAAIVSSLSLAVSGVLVARVNATKTDVGKAKAQAAAANDAAVEARDLARPTGNGYADESRAAWSRIENQLEQLSDRQVRTNAWLTRHLADHAQNDIRRHDDPREGTEP
jgi:hypothetical protein